MDLTLTPDANTRREQYQQRRGRWGKHMSETLVLGQSFELNSRDANIEACKEVNMLASVRDLKLSMQRFSTMLESFETALKMRERSRSRTPPPPTCARGDDDQIPEK